MTFASNMQNTALKLLTKYGQSIAISRVDEGNFNPADGSVGAGSTTSFTGVGYPWPYNKNEIDGEVIWATDIQLHARTSQEIKIGDIITFNDKDHRVMNVENINAQGQNIVYRVQLRA